MKNRFQVAKKKPVEARTTVDGQVFDSVSEMQRYETLRRNSEIRNLRRQVKMPLVLPVNRAGIQNVPVKIRSDGYPKGRECVYTIDFVYEELQTSSHGPNQWVLVHNEHKGIDDPTSRLRRGIIEAIYGIQIHISGPAAMPHRKRSKLESVS